MRNHQVRWCTLNKLEISFKYVTNTLQYVGVRCHGKRVSKFGTDLYLRHTLDARCM